MPTIKTWLFLALGGFAAFYVITWLTAILKSRRDETIAPTPLGAGIGFVTAFFDTLGIGSFATTTSIYKLRHLVRDERIPGTLNIGHTLATILQAFIFIAIVDVDMKTLILLIAASILGMWLGAGVVAGWPRRKVQIGMG
ncbi:MAG: TSUP family transporter, partial [Pyrinomonadaceae bacterium]